MTGGDFRGAPSSPLGGAGLGGGLTGHPSSPRTTAGGGVAAEADRSRLGPSPPAGLAGPSLLSSVPGLGLGFRVARSGPASLTGGSPSSAPASCPSSPSNSPGKRIGPGIRVLSAHPSWKRKRSVARVGPGQAPPATAARRIRTRTEISVAVRNLVQKSVNRPSSIKAALLLRRSKSSHR